MAWKAGYGQSCITPEIGCDLCGYGFYLDRQAESVLDDLMIRVVYIESPDRAGMLIVCDLIGLSPDRSEKLREAAAEATGIDPCHILLACTHTHSGPVTASLTGLGEEQAEYSEFLRKRIVEAACLAQEDAEPATLAHGSTQCEPIGYNRVTGSFDPLDSELELAVFRRRGRSIFLLNYACHPVTLFRSKEISADWCGAVCREIQAAGQHAVLFQGFCGDVDPVTRWNGEEGWGYPQDIVLYGQILARRALCAEPRLEEDSDETLRVVAESLDMPIAVPPNDAAITEEFEKWKAMFAQAGPRFDVVPNAGRFVEAWQERALLQRQAASNDPLLRAVPFAAWRLGRRRLLGVPAETFTSIGLSLKSEFPGLMRLGYANGDIGYLPDTLAFDNPFDYAAYLAPKIYTLFPFERRAGEMALQHCRNLLIALEP